MQTRNPLRFIPPTLAHILKNMKIFPFERINYRTRLSEDEIIKRLNDMVEPEKLLLFRFLSRKVTKPYEGHINTRKFSIRRKIDYGNSFHPRIKGELQKDSKGERIIKKN